METDADSTDFVHRSVRIYLSCSAIFGQFILLNGVVVWFQDEFALPIDPDVLDKIQRLN